MELYLTFVGFIIRISTTTENIYFKKFIKIQMYLFQDHIFSLNTPEQKSRENGQQGSFRLAVASSDHLNIQLF